MKNAHADSTHTNMTPYCIGLMASATEPNDSNSVILQMILYR